MATQLAAMDTRYGFTPEQIDVIKATIAPGASNDELALFLMVCQKTGLDPFSRQIYLSERRTKDPRTDQWVSKKTPETTIDGFRVIAERSGQYAGQLGPFWCGDDGEWKDVWLSRDKMPSACRVGILRHDFREPVWGVALFEEYVQTTKDGTPNTMWRKMGANQLAKCAESLGLRKAFPRDLSGMYSKEEMAQAEERGSKEAQREVADRKIQQLSAAPSGSTGLVGRNMLDPESSSTSPATIIELADSLDMAREPSYEQRQAAVKAEAAEALKTEKKAKRKRGTIKFEALPAFAEMKRELHLVSGSDEAYYDILKLSKVNHADELNAEQSKDVYKLMLATQRKLKADKALREEVEAHALRIGAIEFTRILGANGWESINVFLAEANGVQVQATLDDLKAAGARP